MKKYTDKQKRSLITIAENVYKMTAEKYSEASQSEIIGSVLNYVSGRKISPRAWKQNIKRWKYKTFLWLNF